VSEILRDLSEPALIAAVEANLFEMWRLARHWSRAEVHDGPDLLWVLTDVPFPLFNSVLRARLEAEEADDAIQAAISRCRSRGVPMLWWTGPATRPADLRSRLEAQGFSHGGDSPGMAADLLTLPDEPQTPGMVIEEARDMEALENYHRVIARVFQAPDFTRSGFLEFLSMGGFGRQAPLRSYVGWLEGEPVATSTLVLGAGVAGIYNVATLPEARGRGIGTAITLAPLREARDLGYRVAVLQSSQMGFGVYRRIGFRQYCTVSTYVWAPEAGPGEGTAGDLLQRRPAARAWDAVGADA
jgi:ribosomal protein S18 acetylase RimI-like enzyme